MNETSAMKSIDGIPVIVLPGAAPGERFVFAGMADAAAPERETVTEQLTLPFKRKPAGNPRVVNVSNGAMTVEALAALAERVTGGTPRAASAVQLLLERGWLAARKSGDIVVNDTKASPQKPLDVDAIIAVRRDAEDALRLQSAQSWAADLGEDPDAFAWIDALVVV